MAPCPRSTLYKGWTWKRRAHIKSHCMFYIPPVTRVILPSTGISSQPFYLPLLEGKLPPFLPPKPLSTAPTPHNQKTTFRGQIKLQLAHLMAGVPEEGSRCKGCVAWESAALPLHVNIPLPPPFPRSQWENLSFLFLFFLFLSVQTRTMNSSNPARMWQGVNKANQEGDVWPMGCSSHKSLHKPALQRMGPATRAQNASSLHPQTGAPHTHPHSIAPVTLPATDWLAQGLGSFPSVTNTAHSGAQHNSCALGMCVDEALLKAVWKVLLETLISIVYK